MRWYNKEIKIRKRKWEALAVFHDISGCVLDEIYCICELFLCFLLSLSFFLYILLLKIQGKLRRHFRETIILVFGELWWICHAKTHFLRLSISYFYFKHFITYLLHLSAHFIAHSHQPTIKYSNTDFHRSMLIIYAPIIICSINSSDYSTHS